MHDAVMEARIQGRCLSAETLITKGQTSSLFASKTAGVGGGICISNRIWQSHVSRTRQLERALFCKKKVESALGRVCFSSDCEL